MAADASSPRLCVPIRLQRAPAPPRPPRVSQGFIKPASDGPIGACHLFMCFRQDPGCCSSSFNEIFLSMLLLSKKMEEFLIKRKVSKKKT